MMDDNKLYSINELILWLEHPSQQWSGNRPLMYAKYARAELAQLREVATAAREYFHKTKELADFAHIEYEDLEAALAALEQETK